MVSLVAEWLAGWKARNASTRDQRYGALARFAIIGLCQTMWPVWQAAAASAVILVVIDVATGLWVELDPPDGPG